MSVLSFIKMNYNNSDVTGKVALSLLGSGVIGILVFSGCVLYMIAFTFRRKPTPAYTLRTVP